MDDQVVVVAWVSPEDAIMDQSAGHSVLVVLYLDRSISKAQQESVEKIWRQSFLMGARDAKGGMKPEPFLKADVRPDRAIVTIPGTLSHEVRKGNEQPMNSPAPTLATCVSHSRCHIATRTTA